MARRSLAAPGNLGRAVALATVPIGYWLDLLTIWQLYAVGFVTGVCTVFFDVAYQSYLPSFVGREQIVEGNSKLETSRSAAQIAGPGLAGVLVAALTAPVAILGDAASFIVSATYLGRIRQREEVPMREDRGTVRAELLEGLRYVLGHTFQRGLVLTVAISNFFGNVVYSIVLVYAVRGLDLSAATIGVVLALGNIGTLVAALTARRISDRFGVGTTIVGSSLLFGPGTLLIAVAPTELAIPFFIASGFIVGFGVILFNVTAISLIQAITPDRMLGRANASRRFVVWGVIPIGGLVGGALASTIGLRETIFVGAIGSLFAVIPILVSPIRSVGRMSELQFQSSPTASASSAQA